MAELYITIGRQFGSGGREIGKKVAEALGIPYYDKELLAVAAKESGLSHEFLQSYDEKPTNSFLYSLVMGQHHLTPGVPGNTVEQMAAKAQREAVLSVAEKGSCVIVGRCADYVLQDKFPCVNIFIHADLKKRMERAVQLYGLAPDDVQSILLKTDKRRATYYNYYTGHKYGDARNYSLCLDSLSVGIDRSVEVLASYIQNWEG